MIRTVLVETALFLSPFIAYGLILLALKGSVVPQHWSPRALAICAVLAVLLVAAGLYVFEWDRGAPPGSVYVPAHMQDGKFVPGSYR
ncbi:hypothetical protein GCM10007301_07970 [Azorhizobium oxalatiphilum]|uniref:Uncharacterized protein n=1 Tax=Azorhizobium oxalatiphilum TaxID=980631 RepID=A0A917BP85_9HYPH|nr:DUF6111 family protein [Azorhizobium oxalatiphilum]GGF50979.1 hypothetical protein GCM10007301_07970 [Azorhizobium oxalatiphilum]